MSTDKESKRKPLSVGFKGRVFQNHKKRNPSKFIKDKRKRKRYKLRNVGQFLVKKIKTKIRMRKPINKLRTKLRTKFKKQVGLKSLKRGSVLTSPQIHVAIVPKIDIIDPSILMAVVHSVSPMTGMITFLTEDNQFRSIPLEVFMEVAVPMSNGDADALVSLLFAELGDFEYTPITRAEALQCASSLVKGDHRSHCLELAQETANKALSADKVESRIKVDPDEFIRYQRDYVTFEGVPLLQEPVVFGMVLPDEPTEEALQHPMVQKLASFYRKQQSPQTLDKKDSESSLPTGGDDTSTSSSPGWVTPQTGAPYNQDTPSRQPAQGIPQPTVENSPSSARVIPSGKGFTNKEAEEMVQRITRKYLYG